MAAGVAIGILVIASFTFVLTVTLLPYTLSVTKDLESKSNEIGRFAILEPSCSVEADTSIEIAREEQRRYDSYNLRNKAALHWLKRSLPCHPANNDEVTHPTYFAQFTKGLPHDANGIVDSSAYQALLRACTTGLSADFDRVPQAPGAVRDFTNPQASFAFTLEGSDSHLHVVDPAPAFSSAERAADMVENYWMALTRDINYADYATHPTIALAIADMSGLSDYRGPPVSPQNLFRCRSPGCLVGPYISQFMYQPTPMGANTIDMKMTPATSGVDFLSNYTEWLRIQNGEAPAQPLTFGPTPRYVINGRDMAQWVHMDVLFQAYFNAMLQLVAMGAPLKTSIPYQTTELNQMGFGTFGGPHIAYLTTATSMNALAGAWFQKWAVQRTLRPEEFGGRIHLHKTGVQTFPIHADMLNSAVLPLIFSQFGSYLLPVAFPEGSPLHPSYCAGHATVAGAAVTVLKALFQEDWVIPNPLVPDNVDGTTLVPYTGPGVLTVGGELNKLAGNIGIGRNIAGVHYRSDFNASITLGEDIAIDFLYDQKQKFTEPFPGFTFTNFEGQVVQI